MTHREYIGKRVDEIRQSKGLSVRQLAEMSGVNYANICKIENGKYNVSIDILGKICDALGCRVDLIDGNERIEINKGKLRSLAENIPDFSEFIEQDISIIRIMRGNIDEKRLDYFYKPSNHEQKPKEVLKFNSKKEEQS